MKYIGATSGLFENTTKQTVQTQHVKIAANIHTCSDWISRVLRLKINRLPKIKWSSVPSYHDDLGYCCYIAAVCKSLGQAQRLIRSVCCVCVGWPSALWRVLGQCLVHHTWVCMLSPPFTPAVVAITVPLAWPAALYWLCLSLSRGSVWLCISLSSPYC